MAVISSAESGIASGPSGAAPSARFVPVDSAQWGRQDYFAYYFDKIKCRYSITAQVDITRVMAARHGRRFFPVLLYLVMAAVNGAGGGHAAEDSLSDVSWPGADVSRTFRMSFDEQGGLGWWTHCNPVYTLFHKDDSSFSDVWSQWTPDFELFYETVLQDMSRYGDARGIEGRPNKPRNFCSVSSLPWLSFTSFAQDTYVESRMLFPLIRAGKHFRQGGKTLIPIAVCVHHAVADGYHTAWLFERMQQIANTAPKWLS